MDNDNSQEGNPFQDGRERDVNSSALAGAATVAQGAALDKDYTPLTLMTTPKIDTLRAAVRDVADFPSPGIVFKDITPMLADGVLFKSTIDVLTETVAGQGVTKIVGIDARGFIFAAAVADRLGCGFIPVRKKGKLPWKTEGVAYDLEYGSNEIEIHSDAIATGERVWLVDDVLATGGTAAAAAELIQRLGGDLAGMTFLIELGFLEGRKLLPQGVQVEGVLIY